MRVEFRNWKLYLALFLMCMPLFSSIYTTCDFGSGRAVYPKENKVEEEGKLKGDIGIPGPPGAQGVLGYPPTCRGDSGGPITAECLGRRLEWRSIEISDGVGIKVSDSIGFSIDAIQINNEQSN
jgi:hypothetical protein